MKLMKYGCFIFFLCLPIGLLHAQAQPDDDGDMSSFDDDGFGEQLGRKIEQAIERITGRWEDRSSEQQSSMEIDTTAAETSPLPAQSEIEEAPGTRVYTESTVIQDSDVVEHNVVVKNGDLTVSGLIRGSVLVVGGDLQVKSHGKITGDVRVIDGNIIKEDGAVIEGFEDKTTTAAVPYREPRMHAAKASRSFDVPWASEQTDFSSFIFRYNRVESVFIGLGRDKKYYWDGRRQWNGYGSLGWGFKSHTWRGNFGIARQVAYSDEDRQSLVEVGAEGYSLTETMDPWKISRGENTLAAFVFHEDYRDYYERAGYTLHAAYYTQHDKLKTELQLAFLGDHDAAMTNKVDWALFGGNKHFRTNPQIEPGNMRSVVLSGGLTNVSKASKGPKGWELFGSVEVARKNWGGDYSDFEQYVADVRRFQPLGTYENFNIRLRAGSAGGILPAQKCFTAGGLGTLAAYPVNEYGGNRLLLLNAEFVVKGSIVDELDFWPLWFISYANFIFFTDAGYVGAVPSSASVTDGFNTMTWQDFKHDFGVAIGNRSGSFRIGVAWRTDHPSPARLILRIERPF